MLRSSTAKALAAGIALAAATSTAAAGGRPPERRWSVGGGVVVNAEPYRDLDQRLDITPVPLLLYEGRRLWLRGPLLGVRLAGTQSWHVAGVAAYRFQGYDADDSDFLAGMQDRDGTAEVGAQAELKLRRWSLGLQAVADLLDRHGGGEVRASAGYSFVAGRWLLLPRLQLTWQSARLVDYYYGVEPQEATPSRPAHEAGAALNPAVGLTLRRAFARRWDLVASLEFELLDGPIDSSPITETDRRTSLFAGVAYRF